MKDATFGGYVAVHDRPPAFEGQDGRAYSADLWVEAQDGADAAFGGAFVFVRWNAAGDAPDGTLESDWMAHGADAASVEAALRATDLHDVKAALDAAIARAQELGDW